MNSFDLINPKLIDVPLDPSELIDGHSGYPEALAAADTPDALRAACGSASRTFPSSMWIEAKDREAKARENDENKTWGINYIDRFTNQNPSHECTCHALRASMEAARNRQRGIIYPDGPVKDRRYNESKRGSVFLSPLSIYPIANPGRYGGAGCIQTLNIACNKGALPDKIQPFDYGFKHAIQGTTGKGGVNQSSGPWLREEDFPDGWEETAKWFKPDEVIVTDDWEEALCMLLAGIVLGYGRDGHAVPPAFWNFKNNAAGYVDSYDRVLFDSLATFKRACRSGVYGVVTMTTPPDWLHPAGVAA